MRPLTKFGASLAGILLCLTRADQGAAQLSTVPETVTVQHGALTLRGLVWRPTGRPPFPAVLFNHGSGTAADTAKPGVLGRAFVRHGYVFLYLYRRGAGLSANQGTNSAELMSRAVAAGGQSARNRIQLELLDTELGDVRAGLTYLRGMPIVDTTRIAIAGHSFGAQLSLLMAERDTNLRAAILFGTAAASWEGSKELQKRLLDAARRVRIPVFFIHAANDFSVTPGKALALSMQQRGRPGQVIIYPAVGQTPIQGHDFVYRAVTTWEADVFGFLNERLPVKR